MRTTTLLKSAAIILPLAFAAGLAAPAPHAAEPAVHQGGGGLFGEDFAVNGHDPVAYFTEGRPVPGVREHAFEHAGATYLFASAEAKAAFMAAPEKYAPQYGGYCAWAVAQGYTAPIDPQAWTVVDGRLYLNFDRSVQARWEEDIPGNIAKADANWPGVLTR